MTTEQVSEAVGYACMGFKRNEKIAYQRYFLKYFFPCFSHKVIAQMTDKCDLSTVQKTVKRISQPEYTTVRDRVLSRVIMKFKRPEYKWEAKGIKPI